MSPDEEKEGVESNLGERLRLHRLIRCSNDTVELADAERFQQLAERGEHAEACIRVGQRELSEWECRQEIDHEFSLHVASCDVSWFHDLVARGNIDVRSQKLNDDINRVESQHDVVDELKQRGLVIVHGPVKRDGQRRPNTVPDG